MGAIRKIITATDQQDPWMKAEVEAGDFINDSEYIRDLIRGDRARQAELVAIRVEVIKGKRAGHPLLLKRTHSKRR